MYTAAASPAAPAALMHSPADVCSPGRTHHCCRVYLNCPDYWASPTLWWDSSWRAIKHPFWVAGPLRGQPGIQSHFEGPEEEHMQWLDDAGNSTFIIRDPVATKEMLDGVQDVHPKTLSQLKLVSALCCSIPQRRRSPLLQYSVTFLKRLWNAELAWLLSTSRSPHGLRYRIWYGQNVHIIGQGTVLASRSLQCRIRHRRFSYDVVYYMRGQSRYLTMLYAIYDVVRAYRTMYTCDVCMTMSCAM
jgi:hypothetical protein